MNVEFVRVDRALHHRLAQAVARGDEHHVLEAGLGVDGEHHAGRAEVGADHALHAGRQGHFGVREAFVHAVRDRAVVVQRGEHVLHCFEHVVDADHVQERLLLAGERRIRQVFGSGGGAHGKRHLGGRIGHQAVVVFFDFFLQARLEWRLDDPLADFGADDGERAHVVDVQAFEAGRDALAQRCAAVDGVIEEVAERLRRGGEAARHAHAGFGELADHLPERGVLAADRFDIGHAQGLERGDIYRLPASCLVGLLHCCVRQACHNKHPY